MRRPVKPLRLNGPAQALIHSGRLAFFNIVVKGAAVMAMIGIVPAQAGGHVLQAGRFNPPGAH